MRLTIYTDYALRLLMYLAVNDDGEKGLATIGDVAASYRISRNHLMKVAYELGAAGYIETVRGRGGLRLAMAASEIRLGDVVRQTETDMALVPCSKPVDARCAIRSCCVLRKGAEGRRRSVPCRARRLLARRSCQTENAVAQVPCDRLTASGGSRLPELRSPWP